MKPWAYGLGRASKCPWGLSRTGAPVTRTIVWPSLQPPAAYGDQHPASLGHVPRARAPAEPGPRTRRCPWDAPLGRAFNQAPWP